MSSIPSVNTTSSQSTTFGGFLTSIRLTAPLLSVKLHTVIPKIEQLIHNLSRFQSDSRYSIHSTLESRKLLFLVARKFLENSPWFIFSRRYV